MVNSNLSSRVYSDIKNMLINLAFAPGDSLREQVLADMLGVSRTPVREAFQRLAHEGWLQIGDGKRVQVTPVTTADVTELFQLRSVLEPYAAREAHQRGKSRALAGKLDEVLNVMEHAKDDRIAFAQLDMRFHLLLMSQAENERLNRFWKTIHEETSRIAVMTLMDTKRYEKVVDEHAKMLNAFWSKDIDAILDAVNEHLNRSKDALVGKMEPFEKKTETRSRRLCNIYPLIEDETATETDGFLEEMAARFK